MKEARKFGKAIWNITGKKDVDIVFEHPGEQTFPVSSLRGEARRHGGVLRRHDRASTSPSTPASSGCARSASRARISPT